MSSSSSSSSSSFSSSSSPPPETHEMDYIVIPIPGGHGSSPSTSPRVVATQTLSPAAPAAHANSIHLKQASMDEHLLRNNEAIVHNQHWILFGQIGIMILIIVATLLVAQQLEGLACKP